MPKLRNLSVWILLASLLAFTACRTSKTIESPQASVAPPVLVAPVAAANVPELPAIVQPLKVASIFSDNMVLQQGMVVPVWGWGTDGETVTVTFGDQKVSAKTKHGKWTVKLRDLVASGKPEILTVAGSSSFQFTNVVIGEVWVCSGQSNMDWPLSKSFESQADIAASANPLIRLCTVPKVKAEEPLADLKIPADVSLWREAGPETVPTFSAVAYYFGLELHKARGVPIGLVQSSWGGSPAEVWMRHEALEQAPYGKDIFTKYASETAAYQAALVAFEKQKTELLQVNGVKKPVPPRAPWKPSELYNGMIAPILPFAIKGAIWYQGESNAGRAHQYRSLFPDMITNWRQDWHQDDFPFICVQLAPFKPRQPQPVESDWAELREAQLLATKTLPKVGMAVITDVGEEHDIHPTKKAPVGARLALAARALAYDEALTYSGPVYREMKIVGKNALISFDHVGSGLEVRGTSLKGFSICGADRKFYWAVAEVQPGNVVAVHSPNVTAPAAVRYGWADYPVVNLWNKAGLPASPFRTDDFPMVTAPKN